MKQLKNKFRKELKLKKFNISNIEKLAADSLICESLCQLPDIKKARNVAVYAAIGKEVDLDIFVKQMLKDKGALCFPRSKINDEGEIEYEMAKITSLDHLSKARFNIPEPYAECQTCTKNEIDLWVVPGLAFAVDGTRLGRGGGVYDRLLKDASGIKIGVLYKFQMVKSLPCESHDIKMDMLVTDQKIININKKINK